jgi:putative transposase
MGGFYSGPVVGYLFAKSCMREPFMVIDFKGAHYPKAVIVHAVFFYVRYAVSYRDLEEILAERGVSVDHATLNRWVVKYSPLIAANAQTRKKPSDNSWRMPSRDIAVQCPAG